VTTTTSGTAGTRAQGFFWFLEPCDGGLWHIKYKTPKYGVEVWLKCDRAQAMKCLNILASTRAGKDS
jgi:hypothetical protein